MLNFLTEECGVWEKTAVQIVEEQSFTLEAAACWWAIIRTDKRVKSPAAVLVHHLTKGEQPPKLTNPHQRQLYSQYIWDYQTPDKGEGEEINEEEEVE